MRTRSFIGVALAGVLGTVGMAWAQEPILMKMATAAQRSLATGIIYGKYAELVNERAKGRAKIEVFYDGSLGSEQTAIRNALNGSIQIATSSDGNIGAFTDAFFFMNLPYLFETTDGMQKAINGLRDEINDRLAKTAKLKMLLAFPQGGFRLVWSRTKLFRTPGDLRGIKVRALATPVDIALWKAWGANPAQVAWAETYNALQQGVIDGMGLQPTWTYSTKMHELLKYGTQNDYILTAHIGTMPLDYFGKLPKEVQDILIQAGKDAEAWGAKVDAEQAADALKKIEAGGVKIYAPTPVEKAAWREAAVSIYGQFRDKVAPELIQRIRDLQQ